MEVLDRNFINTTTMMSVSTGTNTVARLIDRKPSTQYSSSGDNSDATTTSIIVRFNETQSVDRIVLQNINLKSFRIQLINTVAALFSPVNFITTTSDLSNNSATNLYMYLSETTYCTGLAIYATSTMIANEEKKVGQIWVNNQILQFEKNPDKSQYKPVITRKEFPHAMSDGGTALYVLDKKYKAKINLGFQSDTMRQDLEDLHDRWTPFVFVPYPTGTAWDGRIYEVNWIGGFNFEELSDNYIDNGYKGSLDIRETSS
jgi:hypothetical protein